MRHIFLTKRGVVVHQGRLRGEKVTIQVTPYNSTRASITKTSESAYGQSVSKRASK